MVPGAAGRATSTRASTRSSGAPPQPERQGAQDQAAGAVRGRGNTVPRRFPPHNAGGASWPTSTPRSSAGSATRSSTGSPPTARAWPSLPVQPVVEPGSVRAALPAALPEQPEPLDALLAELDRVVVPASPHWQHPGFFGYFPANASLQSLLGDLLSGGLGAQGMLWSTSPAATEVEQALLDGLADALGLDPTSPSPAAEAGRSRTRRRRPRSSRCSRRCTARTPDWRDVGVTAGPRLRHRGDALVAGQGRPGRGPRRGGAAHRAVRARHPAHEPAAFAAMIAEDRAAGLVPCLSAPRSARPAPAPSTRCARSSRPRPRLGARRRGLGGGRRAVPRAPRPARRRRAGRLVLHRRPQVVATAFDASLLWVRDGRALPAALSITPEYLRNAASESGPVVDYRDWQVPLGRRFRALKLWSVLYGYGLEGLRAHLRRTSRWPPSSPTGWPRSPASPPRRRRWRWCACASTPTSAPARDGHVNASRRSFLTHTVVDGHTHQGRDRGPGDGARARARALGAVAKGGLVRLTSAAGHECQREAPACWPATLLRGGVLRVTTGPRRAGSAASAGPLESPTSRTAARPDALPPARRRRRPPARPAGDRRRRAATPTSTTPRAPPRWRPSPTHVTQLLPYYSSVHRGAGYASQVCTALLRVGARHGRRVPRRPCGRRRRVHPQHHRRAEPAGRARCRARSCAWTSSTTPTCCRGGARRVVAGRPTVAATLDALAAALRAPARRARRGHRRVQRDRRGAADRAGRRDRARGGRPGRRRRRAARPAPAASTSRRSAPTTSRSPGTSSTPRTARARSSGGATGSTPAPPYLAGGGAVTDVRADAHAVGRRARTGTRAAPPTSSARPRWPPACDARAGARPGRAEHERALLRDGSSQASPRCPASRHCVRRRTPTDQSAVPVHRADRPAG